MFSHWFGIALRQYTQVKQGMFGSTATRSPTWSLLTSGPISMHLANVLVAKDRSELRRERRARLDDVYVSTADPSRANAEQDVVGLLDLWNGHRFEPEIAVGPVDYRAHRRHVHPRVVAGRVYPDPSGLSTSLNTWRAARSRRTRSD